MDLSLRLLLAAGLGAAIGLEREYHQKPAGLRTNMLIAVGSALFTILSITAARSGGTPDRISAQIVTGIGFLGGGAIMRHRSSVHGMTTAATIWVNAAIGVAAGMGDRQKLYADVECGATTIREYQIFVPGLLQTRDYTRARRPRQDKSEPFELERAVEARQRRQQELHREGGPSYQAVLDEVAVRRIAADPPIMEAQLRRLVELAGANDRVAIRVLPVDAIVTEYRLPYSPFGIYTYADPGDPLIVVVDTVTTDIVLTEPEEVGPYVDLYEAIQTAALSARQSQEYLAQAVKNVPKMEKSRKEMTRP